MQKENDNIKKINFEKSNRKNINFLSVPSFTAFIYIIVGGLWIKFSDKLLEKFTSDINTIMLFQTLKGWLYVAVTAALIYSIIKLGIRKLHNSYKELESINNRLLTTENELKSQLELTKQSQENLKISEERYRVALDGSNDGVWDLDLATNEIFFSTRFRSLLGFGMKEMGNSIDSWLKLVHPDDVSILNKSIDDTLSGKTKFLYCRFRVLTHESNYKWFLGRGKAIMDANNKPIRMAGSLTNINESVIAEEKIKTLAYYDSLTGLPNRQYFIDYLNNELSEALQKSKSFALMYLDIDNFKSINETFGHALGDKLINNIAQRLKHSIGETNQISRLSGDEFYILLKDITDTSYVSKIAESILNDLKAPVNIDGYELFITASAGIVFSPRDGTDVQSLISNVDTAMYAAKEKGKDNFQFFMPEMNRKILERMDIESSLRQSVINNEFKLHYQPQISITGDIVGLEALIRWYHPVKGFIPPDKFIPVAEDTGMIIKIGEWVLREACSFGKQLADKGYKLNMAVNFSAVQFRNKELLNMITAVLRDTGLNPNMLEMEITESTAMQDFDQTLRIIKELKSMGIKIALDDFGTGYSSLNYLKLLPINCIKMDKSFVHDIAGNKNEQAIAKAIISLASDLSLAAIAEGVETQDQYEWLKAQSCNVFQGYLFSKPLPDNEIESFIENINALLYK